MVKEPLQRLHALLSSFVTHFLNETYIIYLEYRVKTTNLAMNETCDSRGITSLLLLLLALQSVYHVLTPQMKNAKLVHYAFTYDASSVLISVHHIGEHFCVYLTQNFLFVIIWSLIVPPFKPMWALRGASECWCFTLITRISRESWSPSNAPRISKNTSNVDYFTSLVGNDKSCYRKKEKTTQFSTNHVMHKSCLFTMQ